MAKHNESDNIQPNTRTANCEPSGAPHYPLTKAPNRVTTSKASTIVIAITVNLAAENTPFVRAFWMEK